MTTAYESKKYNTHQAAVNVLLIGDDDVVIKTSGILWDALPRFGEIKLVPLSAVQFVDPSTFQLVFFHLSKTNVSAELKALCDLRGKRGKHPGEAVCVVVVPEGGEDVPDSAADFLLTQPVTVETVEEVLRRCSFLPEQSQNDCSSSTSPNPVVVPKPETEPTGYRTGPGTHAQESSRPEVEASAGMEAWSLEGPSAELSDGDLQAFLHSRNEQKRRTQIRESCERLRELIPFIRSRTDTASTLELTVKYMAYIRQRLPQDILDEVVKALEENGPEAWFKPTKAPKKRTTATVRSKRTQAPAPEPTYASFADDFIAAHVLGRRIQPKADRIPPTGRLPPAVRMGRPFGPPPSLHSSLAPSVALGPGSVPFAQTFVMNQACSEQPAMGHGYAPPVFWRQACAPVSSVMVNQNFLPQMVHNPPMTRALVVEESSLPPIQTLMVGPEFLPPVGLDPGYLPPSQLAMMNQAFTPPWLLNDLSPLQVTSNPPPTFPAAPRGGSDCRSVATAATREDRLLAEILYDSAPPSLPSLSSSHGTFRVDNLPQSSAHEPTFSSALSGPPRWDFSCENVPVYPLLPYLPDGLPPPSNTHQIPAQNAPHPGSGNHFLGEVSTTKLYGQHYTGATDFHINWGNASS